MPQRILCDKCREILYEGAALKPPYEVALAHNGKCPKCRKNLSTIPISVEVATIK